MVFAVKTDVCKVLHQAKWLKSFLWEATVAFPEMGSSNRPKDR
jgi:hypothetical protein